ncbi:fasciclin domain-containing protein [Spirosoma endbachense]|uniref:Fasciclin domain-containing protein n=1 Tax=Spirosoma endbachense TaxID=2666025 RepID=A0A6P1W9H7_9BACT|nr:fasciclin domain-containing protein [Spirosoma endbachense]QHW00688.1 fasciclin domain-containing protein [Spirosoma endbachense]
MTSNQYSPSGRKWGLLSALLVALIFTFSACKKNDDNTPTVPTIYDLINNGNGTTNQFTLFKKAITRANLAGALRQPGTYTVFAPTDAAFKLLGPAYADTVAINNIPIVQLTAVLQYHILSTKTESAAIPTALLTPVPTLGGSSLYLSKVASTSGTSSSISANGARIVLADQQASNGVVHVIDRVLVPPILGDLVGTIQAIPGLFPTVSFTFLQAAVAKVGAASSLTGTTPLTVFAPTDAAFTAAIPTIKTVADINALPVATLGQILQYHIVPGRVFTPLISSGSSLTTAQTGTITYAASTTAITVTGKGNGGTASNIIFPDIPATNGVINVVDRLLLPQ